MMGTSLLSMPWAIKEAGFISGIVLLLVMAGIMMYTCYRVQKAVDIMKEMVEVLEFSDVCKQYFGKAAEVVALVSSLTSLLGGMIVYWILMSNFLYHVVSFIFYESENNFNSSSLMNHTTYSDAVCPNAATIDNSSLNGAISTSVSTLYHSPLIGNFPVGNSVFDRIWDEEKTVPFFLIILMAPLVNFKSPTIFTKMNALGAVSVMYLFIFTAVKSAKWGIHIDFSSVDSVLPDYTKNFRSTFPALTGVSALAYFVQNSCISITRNQKNPKNNVRDIILAYILVAVSYVYIGSIFYSSYPLSKSCIQDNLLNNIETNDVMAFVARIGLFFQILCVFPLLIFIFRLQFLHYVFGSVWPSLKHVLVLNVVLIGVCIIFAIFLPHIGRIIGFVGAFCGFSFGICLPCLVYLKACHLGHGGLKLTWPKIVIHCILIVIGFLNFVGQFTIIGKTN
ncbi:neutral amino acid transporter 9 [Patella vulgata]|uniref:neutral amino acid transporter 9 n=1 Tax=Patella vulgata TaxID=6465 RepID=UPI00217FE017|nr:neutral amino acid transporter 9 [Patella vulgata]